MIWMKSRKSPTEERMCCDRTVLSLFYLRGWDEICARKDVYMSCLVSDGVFIGFLILSFHSLYFLINSECVVLTLLVRKYIIAVVKDTSVF